MGKLHGVARRDKCWKTASGGKRKTRINAEVAKSAEFTERGEDGSVRVELKDKQNLVCAHA